MTEISSVEEADRIVAGSHARPVLLLKHSTRCGISAYAHGQFTVFQRNHPGLALTYARVLVIENRPVSLWLADRLNVRHASPQVILIAGGSAVWHASQFSVNEQAIADAVNATAGKEA